MNDETQQRTDDWFSARCGLVTASRIADLTARTKSGWSSSRERYMGQLVVERLTQRPMDSYQNAAMQRGIELEPAAIAAYEALRLCVVEPVGFLLHPNITLAGASPDGLVGDDGLVEVKCPETHTHLDTLVADSKPRRDPVQGRYRLQMQWQMAVTGRAWCDYVSFDDRVPEHLQLFVTRVERDDALIAELEGKVMDFLEELDERIESLRRFENGLST